MCSFLQILIPGSRFACAQQDYLQTFKASEHRAASAAEVLGPRAAREFFSIIFAKWPNREGSRVLRTAALHEALPPPPRSQSRILASGSFGACGKQKTPAERSSENPVAACSKVSCAAAAENPFGRGREKPSVKWEDVESTDIDADVLSNDSDSFKIADRKPRSLACARRSMDQLGSEPSTPPMGTPRARMLQLAPVPLPHGDLAGRMSARARGMVARAERRHGVVPASWAARTATTDETRAAVVIQSATRRWLARRCAQRRRRQRDNHRLLSHPLLAQLSSQDLKMLTREKVLEEQSQARQYRGERNRELRRRSHRGEAGEVDASGARLGRFDA